MNQYMPRYLKTKNRMMIFDLFRNQHLMSRAELVRITGISFPTVSKIVDKLLELGIVIELEETEQSSGAGRKGHLLKFNPRACYAIGIEFEGQVVHLGLVDMLGTCQYCRSIYLPAQNHTLKLSKLTKEINTLMTLADNDHIPVLGIGIGFPAMINPETNSIIHMSGMNIEHEVPFVDAFSEFASTLTVPFFLDNDVKYACQGEAFLRRKNPEYQDLIYFTLGTGCGVSYMMNGELWYGATHKSGEIGNMMISSCQIPGTEVPEPTPFEQLINLDAIYKHFQISLQQNPGLPESIREDIINYLCPYLSFTLSNISYLLDIQHCVLTGIVPLALGEGLLQKIQDTLRTTLTQNTLLIEPSISRDAGIIGAAVTVFNKRLEVLFKD
ncbi:MAG TPA: hypothetical protein DC053_02405 [Lachnoclostridium sp.]|nr:hypothetical protein [Lachnoclostridium sp.]